MKNGHEIHVLTGREIGDYVIEKLSDLGIYYDQLFSITSYHKEIGTYVTYKGGDSTQPLIAPHKWDRTKADYAEKAGLDFHIDDSPVYGRYFKGSTQYIFYSPAIKTFLQLLLGMRM
jgi:hypothetical protein